MIKKVAHIAIAVQNLPDSLKYYTEVLGLECTEIEEIPEQQVRVAMLPVGDTHIELVEAMSPESPIAKFIAERGEGMHHIAFCVSDLQGTLTRLQENQIALIDSSPREGADGRRIAFLHPGSTHGVLTELCE